jgi:hypothetical protein
MTDSLSPGSKNPFSANNPAEDSDDLSASARPDNLGNREHGLQPPGRSFARDTGPMTPERVHEDHLRSEGTTHDYDAGNVMPELTDDELSRLSILASGESLRADELYYDLDDRERGPFSGSEDERIDDSRRLIARSSTDAAVWDDIVGKRNPSLPNS